MVSGPDRGATLRRRTHASGEAERREAPSTRTPRADPEHPPASRAAYGGGAGGYGWPMGMRPVGRDGGMVRMQRETSGVSRSMCARRVSRRATARVRVLGPSGTRLPYAIVRLPERGSVWRWAHMLPWRDPMVSERCGAEHGVPMNACMYVCGGTR